MDPHHAEYLAAVACLSEQTPHGDRRAALNAFSIGCHITFRLRGWGESTSATGRVADIHEARMTLLVETPDDIVEVDPRAWPVGNVLPF